MRRLTDRTRLAAVRARALTGPRDGFLDAEAAALVHERLTEVNRTFTSPAVVQPRPDAFDLPGATVVPDDDTLALAEGAHDLVVHFMALHWADDPVGQLIQCRRALRPDGLFVAVLLGGRTLHELRTVLAEAETRTAGGLAPRIAPMAEIRDLGALLFRAGLALPVADSVTLDVAYRDLRHLARDLRAMGEGNALADRGPPLSRATLAEADRLYSGHFGRPDGRIAATFELIFLTGWAPHASQQTPLRPGSAAHRLADALGTEEVATGVPTFKRPH